MMKDVRLNFEQKRVLGKNGISVDPGQYAAQWQFYEVIEEKIEQYQTTLERSGYEDHLLIVLLDELRWIYSQICRENHPPGREIWFRTAVEEAELFLCIRCYRTPAVRYPGYRAKRNAAIFTEKGTCRSFEEKAYLDCDEIDELVQLLQSLLEGQMERETDYGLECSDLEYFFFPKTQSTEIRGPDFCISLNIEQTKELYAYLLFVTWQISEADERVGRLIDRGMIYGDLDERYLATHRKRKEIAGSETKRQQIHDA